MVTQFNVHPIRPTTKDFVCLTVEAGDGEGSLLQRLMGGPQIPSPTLPLSLYGDQMGILVLKLLSLGLILNSFSDPESKVLGGNEADIAGRGGTVGCSSRGG